MGWNEVEGLSEDLLQGTWPWWPLGLPLGLNLKGIVGEKASSWKGRAQGCRAVRQ